MMINRSQEERREVAIEIWKEVIRLVPSDVHVRSAIVGVMPEANELAEELCEYLQAMKRFPGRPKQDLFFGE